MLILGQLRASRNNPAPRNKGRSTHKCFEVLLALLPLGEDLGQKAVFLLEGLHFLHPPVIRSLGGDPVAQHPGHMGT